MDRANGLAWGGTEDIVAVVNHAAEAILSFANVGCFQELARM